MSLPLSRLSSVVKESFVKIGDTMEIFPTFGKKRTVSLVRTKVEIRLRDQPCLKVEPLDIYLPGLKTNWSHFRLTLEEREDVSVYNLKVIDGSAFKINGKYCNDAYIQHHDEVLLGHNRLYFPAANSLDSDKSLVKINESINTLIEGETGVGKTTYARELHRQSERVGEFVHINISSFPVSLLESELFGHVKGAFTGAITDKIGALAAADGGTLFIDEVDSLSKDLQVKLLTFLDDRKYRSVGSIIEKKINVSIIFASGQCLRKLMITGEIRKDLYFRIASGFNIQLKPLRKDKEKIRSIFKSFQNDNNVFISPSLQKYLLDQPWPGNIRQLLGHLQKKKVLSSTNSLFLDETDYDLLNLDVVFDDTYKIVPFRLIKENYYKRAFSLCDEDMSLTAKKLDISLSSLRTNLALVSH